MCVVCLGYGGLGGCRDGGGGWYECGTKPGVGLLSAGVGSLPECGVKTPVTPDHTAFLMRSSGYC